MCEFHLHGLFATKLTMHDTEYWYDLVCCTGTFKIINTPIINIRDTVNNFMLNKTAEVQLALTTCLLPPSLLPNKPPLRQGSMRQWWGVRVGDVDDHVVGKQKGGVNRARTNGHAPSHRRCFAVGRKAKQNGWRRLEWRATDGAWSTIASLNL